jgi:starch-binding outer membrane protein, SusD/RagB family
MKRTMKYLKISTYLFLFLALFSCKKALEIKETDFIGGDVALKTVANNQQAVIGAYAILAPDMDIHFNAVMSDELKKAEFYNAATVHEWQFSTQDISIRDNFTAITPFYRVIDRANRVLRALPNSDSMVVGDNVLRTRLRGEALFLRAYAHFELFRYYAPNYDPAALAMAYMTTPSLEPQARITQAPFFQQLVADLAEAKTLLPATISDVYRANNSVTVAALQARVALYMKDWANAVTYSTEYINAVALSPRTQFTGIWTDANNNEVSFKLRRTTSFNPYGRIGSLFRNTSSSATNLGTVSWTASDKLWNSYDMVNDIRFSAYFKDEALLAAGGRPSHLVAKYAGTAYGTAGENVADLKVFRTGEMYLIRAEARAELGSFTGTNSAESDINALRTARIAGYAPVTFTSKQQAIDAVIDERFKELAYEGHRFWDLKRRNLPVSRLASDAPASAVTLPAGNFRFTLPIPQTELQANPKIQQNTGY